MLATVLKGELAVQQSIFIMRPYLWNGLIISDHRAEKRSSQKIDSLHGLFRYS